MSLFNELKRRNVFKVAIAYIVAAWVLMQVADVVLNNIAAPNWVFHVLLLFLSIGFPVAVILAWAFELTPDGLKREYEADRDSALVEATTQAVTGQRMAKRQEPVGFDLAIAVLPFVNMSDDAGNEYFSDGISEELLNLLTKIPELRVAARTSSFSYKDKDVNIAQIGEELSVAYLLEGSVRKAGEQVRITAQLIQAADGYHRWSETYDRTLVDVFAIQDEIAAEVVTQLKVTLLGAAPVARETDPEAYALHLQARHLGRQGTAKGFEQSIALYQQALAIAPDCLVAWDGLMVVYSDQTDRGLRPIEEGYTLAREAAERALAIEPDYAKGHARLGRIARSYDRDLASAAQHLERALELDPTDLDILGDAAELAASLGRLDQAIVLQEYVVARDPVNASGHRRMGISYLFTGRLDDAITSFRTALSLSPGQLGAQQLIGVALLVKGEPVAALAAMQQELGEGWRLIGLIMAHHALGQASESDAALAKSIETVEQAAAYNIAFALAFRGEADRAFELLDKAVKYDDPGLGQITNMPMFANIHSDPRWVPFLESLGMSPQQLDAISFKVTLPE